MKKLLGVLSLLILSIPLFSQKGKPIPQINIYTDMTGHLRGNKAAILGIKWYGKNLSSKGIEAGFISDYRYSNLLANRVHNSTKLIKEKLNWQTSINIQYPFAINKTEYNISRWTAGAKLGYSKLNYLHSQNIPSNSGGMRTAYEILNNNEMMENQFQTSNNRYDLMPTLGWQNISKNGFTFDFFAAAGISINQAKTTQGTNYTLYEGNGTRSTEATQGFRSKNENWLAFNSGGKDGFSAVPVIQFGICIGWTKFKLSRTK